MSPFLWYLNIIQISNQHLYIFTRLIHWIYSEASQHKALHTSSAHTLYSLLPSIGSVWSISHARHATVKGRGSRGHRSRGFKRSCHSRNTMQGTRCSSVKKNCLSWSSFQKNVWRTKQIVSIIIYTERERERERRENSNIPMILSQLKTCLRMIIIYILFLLKIPIYIYIYALETKFIILFR